MKTVLALSVLLVACATEPADRYIATPNERVLQASLLAPAPGSGAVEIRRDPGRPLCHTSVFVNGALVAKMNDAEAITLHLPAGDHIIGARGCPGTNLSETRVAAAAGARLAYRISFSGQGHLSIEPTNP